MAGYRPLLQTEDVDVFLTKRGIRRLCNRLRILDFPENPEQFLEKLKTDLPRGYLGDYKKGHYGKGKYKAYKIDFTTYPVGIILINDGNYKAVSAFERNRYPILDGHKEVSINWIYTPKIENIGFILVTKTYKHQKTKRKHGKEKIHHIFQQNKKKRCFSGWR